MSKIEWNAVRTNLDESSCAHKMSSSSPDWDNERPHDKNRGRVIAFAIIVYTSLHKVVTNSCARPGLRRSPADHPYRITKYILKRINLFDFFLRIVGHTLDLVASHINGLPIFRSFTIYQCKYCGTGNLTVLKKPN